MLSQRTFQLDHPLEYPCNCGRRFATQKGMRIHRTKRGCRSSSSVDQQRTVTTDETSEDLSQEAIHSAENIHVGLTDDELFHLTDGKRDPINFPPASAKSDWEHLDQSLSNYIDHHLKGVKLEQKLDIFGEIVYQFCSKEFGAKETTSKNVVPHKSRRQKQIEEIRKQKNISRRRFKNAVESEKEGLRQVWQHLKTQHNALSRAERLCKKRRTTKKARETFFKDPFKFARELFEKPRSGSLTASKDALQQHLRETYSDERRNLPLDAMSGLVWPSNPGTLFNTNPPTLQEVLDTVKKARCKSAPGPNGVPYTVYKRCPTVLKKLFRLLKSAWKRQIISKSWNKANGVYIPKEQNSVNIVQFRPISLLNVEGKIFFSVMAKRLTAYLLVNGYIDTSVQKGGIPGFPGCLEHASMIWEAIQRAKTHKLNLHVIWLDLANAYGSVPHQMLWQSLQMYHVPDHITTMLKRYYADFAIRFSSMEYTTEWINLQVGIAMGCTISPILFVLAMQVILKAAESATKGPDLGEGCYMPSLKAFMDDTTILTSEESHARGTLARLDDLISWCRMSFKPSKSRSLSIKRGRLKAVVFTVSGQTIPTVQEEPVKSLGRVYDASLKDTRSAQQVTEMAVQGLQIIDRSRLIGKFKIWCLQFMLIPKLMWPLLVYDICTSRVEAIEKKVSKFTRKWLGVPPGLTDVALYSKSAKLTLPFKSVLEEYKVGKARLAVMLQESPDESVRMVEPSLKTGRKWKVNIAVKEARESLQLKEVIGITQTNRRGFGYGDTIWWSKASTKQRREMILREIRDDEEKRRVQKAAQQVQQGQWTTWDVALQRSLTWNDFWHMAPLRLSFIVRSMYDLLPSATNLVKWGKTDDARCPICDGRQTLEHVLSSCRTAFGQGRFTWRHNRVLNELAATVDRARMRANNNVHATKSITYFLRSGQTSRSKQTGVSLTTILDAANDWEMAVDLPGQGSYPECIRISKMRPDIVIYSTTAAQLILVELTVPWESRLEEQHTFKLEKYRDLCAELRQQGRKVHLFAVEVGARGLVSGSVYDLLKQLGIKGGARTRAMKSLGEVAEKSSTGLWSMRQQ